MATAPLSESSHPRTFRENTYVYPVLSRRSNGISVGINLNPDRACNFDCIYCQVDRTKKPQEVFVGLAKLLDELNAVLSGLLPGGALWNEPEFAPLAADKKRVNDIAFSGDGEPTTFRNFSQVIKEAVRVKEALGFAETKVVIISNATGFDRPDVRDGLRFLDAHNGEIWAKLDAGTPGYFKLIDHTDFPFDRVLKNILDCARERPTVIQSCFMNVRGSGPDSGEVAAYAERLREVTVQGGTIKLVQIYTVARNPAYSIVSSLNDAEVDRIASEVRRVTKLPTASFYGHVAEGQGLMGAAPTGA